MAALMAPLWRGLPIYSTRIAACASRGMHKSASLHADPRTYLQNAARQNQAKPIGRGSAPGRQIMIKPTCLPFVLDTYLPVGARRGDRFFLFRYHEAFKAFCSKWIALTSTYFTTRKYVGNSRFSYLRFPIEALDAFNEVMKASFEGNRRPIEQYTDGTLQQTILADLSKRSKSGLKGTYVRGDLIARPRIVHASLARPEEKTYACQVTLEIKQNMAGAFHDQSGRLVGGSLEVRPSREFIVFERMISEPKSKWRMVGRVDPATPRAKHEANESRLTSIWRAMKELVTGKKAKNA
eukprot:Opistho-2@10529